MPRRRRKFSRECGCVPYVGLQPRTRTKTGRWRKKRSDAGKHRRRKSFLEKLFSF